MFTLPYFVKTKKGLKMNLLTWIIIMVGWMGAAAGWSQGNITFGQALYAMIVIGLAPALLNLLTNLASGFSGTKSSKVTLLPDEDIKVS